MDVTFRKYVAADLPAMYSLDRECFTAPFRFSRSAMAAFASAKSAWTCVAITGRGILAAFVILQLEQNASGVIAYIVTLDVSMHLRRTGVATRLMRLAEEAAKAQAAATVTLHVHTENRAAIRFYERAGYVRTGMQKSLYAPGIDAFTYCKLLQAGS